jgi:effector-binding domain-containing protein
MRSIDMLTEPKIIERAAQPYAAIRTLVTMQTIGEVCPPLNGEVFGWLGARGIAPAGAPFWKYNIIDMAGDMELEIDVATAIGATADDRVHTGTLPAGRYVTLHHVGHPSELMNATKTLLDWAAERQLTWDVTDDRWAARLELYGTDPSDEPDMTKWETDLAFRLAD